MIGLFAIIQVLHYGTGTIIRYHCTYYCIWNPDHLDRIGQTCTYVSEHGTDMYVHVHTCQCS